MATLYELTTEYQSILDMAQDPDIDPEVLADTMEGLDYEIEVKADGYAKIIRQLTADSEAYKVEIARLEKCKKTVENSIDSLKRRLKASMEAMEKDKIKTDLFTLSIRKNPPKVVFDEELPIPKKYLIPQEPKVDTASIKEDLKKGEDLKFARLVQETRVDIR